MEWRASLVPWTFDHWWWWQKGFAAFGIAGQSSTGVSGRLQRDLKIDIYIYIDVHLLYLAFSLSMDPSSKIHTTVSWLDGPRLALEITRQTWAYLPSRSVWNAGTSVPRLRDFFAAGRFLFVFKR